MKKGKARATFRRVAAPPERPLTVGAKAPQVSAPQAVMRWLKEAKKTRAKIVRRFRQTAKQAQRITCGGIGCYGCCYQLVLCSVWEGALIARHLLEADKGDLLRRASEQGERAWKLLEQHVEARREAEGEAPAEGPAEGEGEGEGEDGKLWTPIDSPLSAWYGRHEACAFLNAAGACEIYGLRPVTCSAYLAVSDPALCFARESQIVRIVDSRPVTRWAHRVDEQFAGIVYGKDKADGRRIVEQPLGRAVNIGFSIWKQLAER